MFAFPIHCDVVAGGAMEGLDHLGRYFVFG